MDRTQQLLKSLLQKLLAPTHLFSRPEAELTNLDGFYTSYKPLILAATQLLKKEPSFDGVLVSNKCMRRSLYLSWEMLSAGLQKQLHLRMSAVLRRESTNWLYTAQPTGNFSPCHLHSKCPQVCHSGEQATHQHSNDCSRKDTTGCYNTLQFHTFTVQQPELPTDCTSCLLHSSKCQRFPILYERSCHTYNGLCWCSHNWNTLSPHALPVKDLRKMLLHIKETLPLTMHLPISSEDALHFYRDLCTHILVAYEQFLLLIDVPIQDCTQQLKIYEVF